VPTSPCRPRPSYRGGAVDDFLVGLTREYPGYYKDTYLYIHDLVVLPDRLVRYAARELLVADIAPDLMFFGGLMSWLHRGHWPLGWQGNWPSGRLMLW